MLRLQDTEYVSTLMTQSGDVIKSDLGEPTFSERIISGQEVLVSVLQVMKAFNVSSSISGLYQGEKTEPYLLETTPIVVESGDFDPVGALDALGDLIVVLKGSSLSLGLRVDKYFGTEELADTTVIREFMVAVKQDVRESPLRDPDEKLLALRAILVLEEAFELLEEGLRLGIQVGGRVVDPLAKTASVKVNLDLPFDPEFARHALIEAVIAVKKAGLRLGLPVDSAVLDQIGPSNLSKLDENGEPIYREDGKVMKSDRYFEADFRAVLDGVGYPL